IAVVVEAVAGLLRDLGGAGAHQVARGARRRAVGDAFAARRAGRSARRAGVDRIVVGDAVAVVVDAVALLDPAVGLGALVLAAVELLVVGVDETRRAVDRRIEPARARRARRRGMRELAGQAAAAAVGP